MDPGTNGRGKVRAGSLALQHGGLFGNRGKLKKIRELDRRLEFRSDCRVKGHEKYRGAPELRKGVVDAHGIQTKNATPDRSQAFLSGRPGGRQRLRELRAGAPRCAEGVEKQLYVPPLAGDLLGRWPDLGRR